MKLVQVNPKEGIKSSIYTIIIRKELELRDKKTTFFRSGKNKWKHKNYNGWITLSNTAENILFAKVQSKVEKDEERLLESFIGYLTRHCRDMIYTITIYYSNSQKN